MVPADPPREPTAPPPAERAIAPADDDDVRRLATSERAGDVEVEVVYCAAPGLVDCRPLTLPAGSTAADALRASGLAARHGLDAASIELGVWSRVCPPDTVLRDRDRVELYRPLTVDPKEARRLRYRRRGR
jgi:putative ubiquitin-RnfH superfamily antitoxin RatB of RatAB toxin-antitoxin module